MINSKESLSLKEIASLFGVSYEAIRKHVNKYENELKPHISIQNKTKYIDPEGQEFLYSHINKGRVYVVNRDRGEEIREQEQELNKLKTEMIELQKLVRQYETERVELIDKSKKVEALLEDKKRLEEENTKNIEKAIEYKLRSEASEDKAQELVTKLEQASFTQRELKEQNSVISDELEAARGKLENTQNELEEAQNELAQYSKSIFGFYRKKK